MSQQNTPLLTLTVTLTGAVAAARFVTPAGAQSGAGAVSLGVSRSAGAIGEKVPVDAIGTAIVETGGAYAAGATLGVDAQGRAITYAAGAKVAIALQASTGAGQFQEALLLPNA